MGMGSLPYGKTLLPRPFVLLAGFLIVAAAALAGWFAAGQLADRTVIEAPTTPALNVHTGAASLELRPGWQLEQKVPRVPGLDGTDARALAPADGGRGRMVVAMLDTEPGDIPQATADALRVPLPKAERATVARQRFVGYSALSLQGVNGLTDIYTLHTPQGLLTIACIA